MPSSRSATAAEQKAELRRQAIAARNTASAAFDASARAAFLRHFLSTIPLDGVRVAAVFWPVDSEIDAMALAGPFRARGIEVALPVVMGKARPLEFRAWYATTPMASGAYAIPYPTTASPRVEPDLIVVPLLAFDRWGYRLGYGGGFYDRTLEAARSRRPVIAAGIAYAGQEVGDVPRDRHDQPLDWIVTEAGAFQPGPESGTEAPKR